MEFRSRFERLQPGESRQHRRRRPVLLFRSVMEMEKSTKSTKVWFVLCVLVVLPALASAHQNQRWEAGAVLSGTFLKDIGSSDSGIGTSAAGFGGRLAYGVIRHVDLESELVIFPNN